MRVLMVEDQRALAEAIEEILKRNKYSVDLAFNGEYGLNCALSGIYDIIILDIMLPQISGIQILKEIRKNNIQTPVILLTAKGETEDKILGLDSGADDYLTKPFPTEELLARLRALGRRKGEIIINDTLKYGDIELNINNLEICCNKNKRKLTLKESQILELLIKREGLTVSKNSIIEKLWGYETEAEDNNVEVHISFLRKKINSINSQVTIKTIRCVGYTLSVKKGG